MIAEAVAHLASATLAVSVAIVVALILRTPVSRRFGAQAACALWNLVPFAAAATLLPAPLDPGRAIAVFALPALTQAPMVSASPASATDPMAWIFWIWLSGAAACVATFGWQQRRFVRALGHVFQTDDGLWQSESFASGPALLGALRPRIVLPPDFSARYTARERNLIVAHELAHRARGDAQTNALATALRCLFWFNPLVHFAASRFRLDQELACDASVIARFPHARRSYADAMLKTHLATQALPIGCHWHAGHPLKERIAMLKFPLPTRARRASGLLLVFALGASASYLAWAAQPPRAPAVVDQSVGKVVDAQLIVTVADEAPESLRMVNALGHPFTARGDGVNPWQAEFNASAVADGNIKLAMVLRQGGAVIGKPVIVVKPGKPASVEVSGPDGRLRLRIDATLALHDAGWRPARPQER